MKILAEDAADYVETLVTRYLGRRADGESFSAFVRRLDDADLARFARPEVVLP